MAGTELALQFIPDHNERSRKRLPFQFWEAPRLAGLARGIGDSGQVLENLILDLLDGQTLDTAIGVHLERWGAIVGERRGSLEDHELRRFIRARLRANRWAKFGTVSGINEQLRIYEIVMDARAVRYFPTYHAGFALVAERDTFLPDRVMERVVRLMLDCKPAGVALDLIEALPGSLTLSGGPGVGIGVLSRRLYP